MELPVGGHTDRISPGCGEAVFVPGHAWNRPDWADRVKVITFLFGAEQVGISLVTHRSRRQRNRTPEFIKTSVPGADIPSKNILNALGALTGDIPDGPLPTLLTESLLYSCLRLLRAPESRTPRKALHTYEVLCLS